MKEKLRKQNGISAIAIILVIVIIVVLGGVIFLGVRSAITGEPFMQPFEDMGLMEVKDDEGSKIEEDIKTEEKDDNTSNELKHYYGKMDFDKFSDGSSLEHSDLVKMSTHIYATETEIKEIVMTFDLKDFLVKYYNEFEKDMIAAGFSTYESFSDEMMKTFETSFSSGFSTSGSQVEDYFEIEYPEKEIFEMHVTNDGIQQMYDNYGIEDGESVKEIIKGFEEALGVKFEEV